MSRALLPLVALALALPAPAALAPQGALPPSVVALERREVPWVVAALALPAEAPSAELWILGALLDEPAAWSGTAVERLLQRGGSFSAEGGPDGLVLVAEGPTKEQALVFEAALAVLSHPVSAAALAPAQAYALKRRALAQADARGQALRALWRAFYGERAPAPFPTLGELELLRIGPDRLEEVRRALVAFEARRLFVEGRFELAALREAARALPEAPAPGPSPRPLLPQAPLVAVDVPGAAPRLFAAQPLPPVPGVFGPLGEALRAAVAKALEPLGGSASLSLHRAGALLVVEVPLDEKDAAAREAELRAALEALRQAPPDLKALDGLLAEARAAKARRSARVGASARASARAHLFGAPPSEEASAAALRDLLRLALLPEALRLVLVEPAPLP